MAKNTSKDWQNPSVSFNNPFAGLKSKSASSTSDETVTSGETPCGDASKPDALTAVVAGKPTPHTASDHAQNLDQVLKPRELRVKFTRLERARRGGKQVTVVGFVQSDEMSREAWLKDVQKRFGIGGSLENEHVILQGDQRERLSEAFKMPKKNEKRIK